MESLSKWSLTDEEKDEFIETLTTNLLVLRVHAEISQEELANVIGVSRQTYSAVERKLRKMSWNTYLSLVFFFDNNQKTHNMLRMLSIYPEELIKRFNEGVGYLCEIDLNGFLGNQGEDIIGLLDEQAKQTIYSIIMMEYARCTQLPSDAIIKSFGGTNYATVINSR